jgi:WD40-like Beta Propeller Repeat
MCFLCSIRQAPSLSGGRDAQRQCRRVEGVHDRGVSAGARRFVRSAHGPDCPGGGIAVADPSGPLLCNRGSRGCGGDLAAQGQLRAGVRDPDAESRRTPSFGPAVENHGAGLRRFGHHCRVVVLACQRFRTRTPAAVRNRVAIRGFARRNGQSRRRDLARWLPSGVHRAGHQCSRAPVHATARRGKRGGSGGTEGARDPFFSPDGQWIAFQANGKLRKIPAAGGPAVVLCSASDSNGGSWSADGNIYAVLDTTGKVRRIPGDGGSP